MVGRFLAGAVAVLLAGPAAWAQDFDDEFYDELDAFAAAHLDGVQPLSFAENVEFCGYYGLDADQQLVASVPTRGDLDGCLPDEPPRSWELVASWHTHGAFTEDADIEVPSVDDLLGDIAEGIDGYVATPGGRVWLSIYDERVVVQLCGKGCITADPNFRDCQAFMPAEEYSLQGLQDRAADDPGYC